MLIGEKILINDGKYEYIEQPLTFNELIAWVMRGVYNENM